MHECPQCWSICFCDLDDSNDCRENGRCFHRCVKEEDEFEDDMTDDPEVHSIPRAP